MTIAPLRRVEFRLFAALAMLAIPFAGLWSSDAPVPVSAGSLHASWAFDVADDRYIVGASDFVFFGEILAATPGPPLTPDLADDTDAPWFPQTAYVVRALSDIKGDLSTRTGTEGEYTMLQAGGIGPAGSEEYFDEDGALQVGGDLSADYRIGHQDAGSEDAVRTGAMFRRACRVLSRAG